jgi:hypothetical protein
MFSSSNEGRQISIMKDATGREVARTEETVISYRARYPRLFDAAGVDHDDYAGAVDWFAAQHNRWAPATISQYRAALRQAIEDSGTTLAKEELGGLAGRLTEGPRARQGGSPRTSARKRRSVPRGEFRRLIRRLIAGPHPDDRLAARLLSHNVLLFLRPVEWQTAAVENGFLIIRNAKATNGRAFGRERRRDLRDYGDDGVTDLCNLLVTLSTRAAAAGGYGRIWARLASRIARACEHVEIKRIAPYSTRHVGMANAKSWMSPAEVAASAGHKTTATATSHYAKRRTGWGLEAKRVARPSAEDVEKVIRSPKASREENLKQLAKSRAEREAEDEATIPSVKM